MPAKGKEMTSSAHKPTARRAVSRCAGIPKPSFFFLFFKARKISDSIGASNKRMTRALSFKVVFIDHQKLVTASSPAPSIETDTREPKVL